MLQNRKSKKMKNTKKLIICLIFLIILTIILAIAYFSIIGFDQKERLEREISLISKMDVTKEISNETKTTGQYKIIEKDLKEYFKEMKNNLNTVLEITQDSRYSTILKVENLKYDGPDFEESFNFLNEAYTKIDECSNYIKNNLTYDDFKIRAESLNLEQEYYDLYMELVNEYILTTEENTKKTQIETSIENFKEIIDYQKSVLAYLQSNTDGWGIDDDSLIFFDTKVMVGYSTIVNSYKYDKNYVTVPEAEEATN